MPPMDKPPMSPDVAGQQPGPNMGPGMAQAQQQMGKDPIEMAVTTVEKILSGIQDETMRPYITKAIASLKIGMGMAKQKQPQSPAMGQPPPGMGAGAPPQIPTPPVPGQMPA